MATVTRLKSHAKSPRRASKPRQKVVKLPPTGSPLKGLTGELLVDAIRNLLDEQVHIQRHNEDFLTGWLNSKTDIDFLYFPDGEEAGPELVKELRRVGFAYMKLAKKLEEACEPEDVFGDRRFMAVQTPDAEFGAEYKLDRREFMTREEAFALAAAENARGAESWCVVEFSLKDGAFAVLSLNSSSQLDVQVRIVQ